MPYSAKHYLDKIAEAIEIKHAQHHRLLDNLEAQLNLNEEDKSDKEELAMAKMSELVD